eukprot:5837747-Amphidinium_carterae.1
MLNSRNGITMNVYDCLHLVQIRLYGGQVHELQPVSVSSSFAYSATESTSCEKSDVISPMHTKSMFQIDVEQRQVRQIAGSRRRPTVLQANKLNLIVGFRHYDALQAAIHNVACSSIDMSKSHILIHLQD